MSISLNMNSIADGMINYCSNHPVECVQNTWQAIQSIREWLGYGKEDKEAAWKIISNVKSFYMSATYDHEIIHNKMFCTKNSHGNFHCIEESSSATLVGTLALVAVVTAFAITPITIPAGGLLGWLGYTVYNTAGITKAL